MRYATLIILITGSFSFADDQKITPNQARFFESRIRPLFANQCYRCHGPKRQRSDLRLDSRARILKGGTKGPSIVPGDPKKSLLIRAVRHEVKDVEMPPDKKLSKQQIADLAYWIKIGAPYPQVADAGEKSTSHWAFQRVADPSLPELDDATWTQSPIDCFILAKLERNGLQPSPIADKRTLLRRATFDLIGLPPTPAEIDDFLNDDSPNAFEEVIDRLLASPRYGERWGRHWLDVARYADSNGLDENVAHGTAWRYRDYVIRAFNADKPFDRFLKEQLAGDLLPYSTDEQRNEQLIATGFLSLGPKVLAEVDERKMEMDIVDEQIDTVSRSFLGLTMGCARCHDHKFDPIETEDYYALAGIFKSTKTMDSFTKIAKWHENPLIDKEQAERVAAFNNKVKGVEEHIKKIEKDAGKKKELAELKKKLAAMKKEPVGPLTSIGVTEGTVVNTKLHVRGSHLNLGKDVARQVPEFLAGEHPPEFNDKQSGRLELAKWMLQRENPLAARVMVNRIWRWHFGKGLVKTTDNFGHLGDKPTHPLLLDHLATRLVEDGWSIKRMHKRIMLSAAYQQASDPSSYARSVDPANQLYWRRDVRRLEAEAIRDTLLSISDLYDDTMGGSMLHVKNREFIFNHTSKDETSYQSYRRSVYLPVVRNHLYDVFQLFDCTDATVLSGNRATTTTAPQALYLMNSELVMRVSEELAKEISSEEESDAERVRRLYRIAYGRPATKSETLRALRFVSQSEPAFETKRDAWASLCQVIIAANEFVYVR